MRVKAPNKRTRLATTSGAVRWLEANEERELDGDLLQLAYKVGCLPVTEEVEEQEQEQGTVLEFGIEAARAERLARVQTAIRELMERGDESAFTSNGQPRVREVAVILGDEITKGEIEAAFAAMSA